MAEAVLDASAAVRGLTSPGAAADALAEIEKGIMISHAPDVIVAEVSNALAIMVRADARTLEDALAAFDVLFSYPIGLHATAPLAPAAIELAATSRLSAYDAFYAVLAAALDVPLVTADRNLAAAVPRAVLVS